MVAPEPVFQNESVLVGRGPAWEPNYLWTSLAMVGLLLFGALVIWLVDRWRKRWSQETNTNSGEQLTQFRKLYEAGDLSAEEFARIRNKLTDQFMKDMDKPSPQTLETPVSGSSHPDSPAI